MSASLFWNLPSRGERGRGEWQAGAPPRGRGWWREEREGRFGPYDYLAQVAHAAEVSGFDGAFIPWEVGGDEPLIIAAALARETRNLVFVPEIQPASATPVYLAKMAVTFQRFARNRFAWKLDLELDSAVRRAHGDFLEGEEWFARAEEYIHVAKGTWTTHPFDFRGRFYDVERGGLAGPLSGLPLPRIYTSGRSDRVLQAAAKLADVHLLGPGPVEDVLSQARRLKAAADKEGREVAAGVRLGLVTRHTTEDAVRVAREGSSPTDLVGDFGTVAARLDELVAGGVRHLVIDARPHLEEAYRFAEHVLPLLSFRARPRPGAPRDVQTQ
jgi:alkanesulfonate monooxygenase